MSSRSEAGYLIPPDMRHYARNRTDRYRRDGTRLQARTTVRRRRIAKLAGERSKQLMDGGLSPDRAIDYAALNSAWLQLEYQRHYGVRHSRTTILCDLQALFAISGRLDPRHSDHVACREIQVTLFSLSQAYFTLGKLGAVLLTRLTAHARTLGKKVRRSYLFSPILVCRAVDNAVYRPKHYSRHVQAAALALLLACRGSPEEEIWAAIDEYADRVLMRASQRWRQVTIESALSKTGRRHDVVTA